MSIFGQAPLSRIRGLSFRLPRSLVHFEHWIVIICLCICLPCYVSCVKSNDCDSVNGFQVDKWRQTGPTPCLVVCLCWRDMCSLMDALLRLNHLSQPTISHSVIGREMGKSLVLWGKWTTVEQFDLNGDQNYQNCVIAASHIDLAWNRWTGYLASIGTPMVKVIVNMNIYCSSAMKRGLSVTLPITRISNSDSQFQQNSTGDLIFYKNKYMEKGQAELNYVMEDGLWHYQQNASTLVIQSLDGKRQNICMCKSFNGTFFFSDINSPGLKFCKPGHFLILTNMIFLWT